jgi:catechol 2,3-dioxygenase-like lactoylglutathione lyase family enzyme
VKAEALLRVSLTVADLTAAEAFYTEALGFVRASVVSHADTALAILLGARRIRILWLRRGNQILELAEFDPPGAPYKRDSCSNDLWFQHIALVTDSMSIAYARLCQHHFTPISRHGPETLPGGIVAFKFRDAEAHPLELIAFPRPDPHTQGGIDHSAISVADADRSIAFYTETVGLSLQSRQVNTGAAQDRLDNLDNVTVDVCALAPASVAPHLELLAYRAPRGRVATPIHQADIAATRLVFSAAPGTPPTLFHDPDAHAILLV